MKKYAIFFSLSLLFLSACGEIEIPAQVPSVVPSPSASPNADMDNVEGSASPGTEVSPGASPLASGNESCTAVLEERNNLSEAVRVAQSELRDCQIEKNRCDAIAKSSGGASAGGTTDSAALKIVKDYLVKVPQAEFPFDLCGPLGNATAKEWYADFTKALEAKNILFKELSRPLKTSDFSRVCASSDGKMAIFIGAKAEGKSEFHMVKYSFDAKSIDPTFLLEGSCDACPDTFGKRRGPFITLSGQVGTASADYEYFYDKNILVTKKQCQGSECKTFE